MRWAIPSQNNNQGCNGCMEGPWINARWSIPLYREAKHKSKWRGAEVNSLHIICLLAALGLSLFFSQWFWVSELAQIWKLRDPDFIRGNCSPGLLYFFFFFLMHELSNILVGCPSILPLEKHSVLLIISIALYPWAPLWPWWSFWKL